MRWRPRPRSARGGACCHHYASKDALISALAERKLREIRESVAAHEAEQGPGPAALPSP